MGRPPLGAAARTHTVSVRLTAAEAAWVKAQGGLRAVVERAMPHTPASVTVTLADTGPEAVVPVKGHRHKPSTLVVEERTEKGTRQVRYACEGCGEALNWRNA